MKKRLLFNMQAERPGVAMNSSPNDSAFTQGMAYHLGAEFGQNTKDAANLMMPGHVPTVTITRCTVSRLALAAFDLQTAEERSAMIKGEEGEVGYFDIGDDVDVLLVEDDAGGLDGDITATSNGTNSPAGKFLFEVGSTGNSKKTRAGGRYNVGSQVGSYASKARVMYVHSRRRDGSRIASARLSLPAHNVGETKWDGNARLGYVDDKGNWGGIATNEDADKMAKAFQMALPGEAGLSLAIVHPVSDLFHDMIVASVSMGQFLQIAFGQVKFRVRDLTAGREVFFDRDGMAAFFDSSEFDALVKAQPKSMRQRLTNAKSAFFELPKLVAAAIAVDVGVGADVSVDGEVRKSFAKDEVVRMRRALSAEHVERGVAEGVIDVYLKKLPAGEPGYTIRVRDGIAVMTNKAVAAGVAALTIAKDDVIADFLGDAENPSHTEWGITNAKRKGWKPSASAAIGLFLSSASDLMDAITGQQEDSDRVTLAAFFPKPGRDANGDGGGGADDGSDDGQPIVDGEGPCDVLAYDKDMKRSMRIIKLSKGAKDYIAAKGSFSLKITAEYNLTRKGQRALQESGGFLVAEAGASGVTTESTDKGQVIRIEAVRPDLKITMREDGVRDLRIAYEVIENETELEDAA